jgi:hypothetical protein
MLFNHVCLSIRTIVIQFCVPRFFIFWFFLGQKRRKLLVDLPEELDVVVCRINFKYRNSSVGIGFTCLHILFVISAYKILLHILSMRTFLGCVRNLHNLFQRLYPTSGSLRICSGILHLKYKSMNLLCFCYMPVALCFQF